MEFVRGLLEELETHKQDYEHAARVRGLLAVVSEVEFERCYYTTQYGTKRARSTSAASRQIALLIVIHFGTCYSYCSTSQMKECVRSHVCPTRDMANASSFKETVPLK